MATTCPVGMGRLTAEIGSEKRRLLRDESRCCVEEGEMNDSTRHAGRREQSNVSDSRHGASRSPGLHQPGGADSTACAARRHGPTLEAGFQVKGKALPAAAAAGPEGSATISSAHEAASGRTAKYVETTRVWSHSG